MASLFLAACATALATGIGVIPVYALRSDGASVGSALWGVAAGVMVVAAIPGLLLPGLRNSPDLGVWLGLIAGVAFLLIARRLLSDRDVRVGEIRDANARRALLIFAVLLVHSLPEGMALGAAWATGEVNLGLFIFLAIALQNIPEGTAAAIPLREAGYGPGQSAIAAVLTSAPQPIGAIAAFVMVTTMHSLLGPSFGFAAGAMLALVVVEIAPVAFTGEHRFTGVVAAVVAAMITAGLGMLLSVA